MKIWFIRCALILDRLVVLMVVTTAFVFYYSDQLASDLAARLYPDLQQPYDNEAPQTPTSFPPSSEIKAVIGGKGEGLNCSIPIESLFFRKKNDEAPLSLQFRQACAFHDYCYRHGAATYGYEQVDCDFMLQQHAYRLCPQIFKYNKFADPFAECKSRARRILLGVRLGGSGSFQEGGFSTYFEFDPVPVKADNYVVARLVTIPDDKPKQEVIGVSGKRNLQRSIFTYHFKRNHVQPRLLTWGSCSPDTDICMLTEKLRKQPIAYPKQAIPTPPQVINHKADHQVNKSVDSLLAVARQEVTGSGVWIVKFPGESKQFTLDIDGVNKNKNKDTAPLKLLHVFESEIELLSISQHWRDKHVSIKREQLSGNKTDEISVPPREHKNRYRLLQSQPIIGHFLDPHQDDVLLLSRGLDDPGIDYSKKAYAYIGDLNRPPALSYGTQLQELQPVSAFDSGCILKLPETYEPMAPIQLTDGRTGLLSIIVKEATFPDEHQAHENISFFPENFITGRVGFISNQNVKDSLPGIVAKEDHDRSKRKKISLAITDVAHCASEGNLKEPMLLETGLDGSWAYIPVHVISSLEKPNTNLLFFSRVLCSAKPGNDTQLKNCAEITAPEKPSEAVVEFKYHRLIANPNSPSLDEVGSGRCRISFAAQLSAQQDKNGKDTYMVPEITRQLKESNAMDKESKMALVFHAFARRWSNSQIIPGRIFVREASESHLDVLDVAVIFNGYPGFSLLISGEARSTIQDKIHGFKEFSPDYIMCQ